MNLLVAALLASSALASDHARDVLGCEHSLIHAETRFRTPSSHPREAQPGVLISFGQVTQARLLPFLQPTEQRAEEFLDDSKLRKEWPWVHEYLRARRDGNSKPGYIVVPTDYIELKAFFSLGVLSPPTNSLHRNVITISDNQLLRPSHDRMFLIFSRDAEALEKITGEFPIWSLLAVVSADLRQLHKFFEQNHESTLGTALAASHWPQKRAFVPIDRPMVFGAPLNPMSLFSPSQPLSESEARERAFDVFDPQMETYSYWIPYAQSIFAVTDSSQNRFVGRLAELRRYGQHYYDPLFIFTSDKATISLGWSQISQIGMLQYIPNSLSETRFSLAPEQVNNFDALIEHTLHPEISARRLLILRR